VLNTISEIRLAGLVEESIVDGPGLRFVIFTQGCHKRCVGCHNPQSLDMNGGYIEDINKIREKWLKNPIIEGITISGGEPFLQARAVKQIISYALLDNLNVVIYSGFYYEELRAINKPDINYILDHAHYLIDGPFEIDKKDLNLLFRGSANQRLIDLQQTKNLQKLVIK